MEIVYPKYLRQEAYRYRHIKIHIVENAVKLSTPGEMYDAIKAKSEEVQKAIQEGKIRTDSGAAVDIMREAKEARARTESAMEKGDTIIATLVLPLPNSLTDNTSHDWNADTGMAKALLSGLEDNIGKIVAVPADMASVRKPLVDPGYFQNYTGSLPRDFTLTFDLIPQNKEDAEVIYAIQYALHKYGAPSTIISSALLTAPHYFKIELSNPYIDTLLRANDVVLKNIDVDYGADGYMQQTPDGIPKHISLSLTFAERHAMTQEMY